MKLDVRNITKISIFLCLLFIFQAILSSVISVQPVTVTLLYLTLAEAFVVPFFIGLLLPILTGLYFGLGIWTIFQCLGWVTIVIMFYFIKKISFKYTRIIFFFASILAAFIFGAISNLSMLFFIEGSISIKEFLIIMSGSIPFDVIHAVNNGVFYILAYKLIDKKLKLLNIKYS